MVDPRGRVQHGLPSCLLSWDPSAMGTLIHTLSLTLAVSSLSGHSTVAIEYLESTLSLWTQGGCGMLCFDIALEVKKTLQSL